MMKTYIQVVSGTTSACKYYMRVDDVTIGSTMPQAAQSMVALLKGKDMTCTMGVSENLGQALQAEKCTGSLVTGYKMLYVNTISSGQSSYNPPGSSGQPGDTGSSGSSGDNYPGSYY